MVLKPNAVMVRVITIMMSTKATLGTPVHGFREQRVVLSAVAGHRRHYVSGDNCYEVYKKTKRYESDHAQTFFGAVDGVR
jgi:hypothetical protein